MNNNGNLLFRMRPKRILRNALMRLPKPARDFALRRQLKIPAEAKNGLVVKIAHRRHELEQAFEVLHDAYVRADYMDPHPSGLRVTSYHALPSTTTVVAMDRDQVVGTVSIIRDGPFGFPSDSILDVSSLRNCGTRIAEISALAVRPDYRQTSGQILWLLLTYLYRYCIQFFGIDLMIIAVHPSHYPFYESILCFKPLNNSVIDNYDFVKGNPAQCGVLNLRESYLDYATHYRNSPPEKSVFDIFWRKNMSCFRYPKRDNFKISDPFLTPELIDYFFRQKTDCFDHLTSEQLSILHNMYHSKEYKMVLPPMPKNSPVKTKARATIRYDYCCKGRFEFGENSIIDFKVSNVSNSGFLAKLDRDIRFGSPIHAKIALADYIVSEVECYPAWKNDDRLYGFKIINCDNSWSRLIGDLESDLKQKHEHPPFSLVPDPL